MREYRLSIAPGQTEEIAVEGQYFRIHDASVLMTVETRPADRKSAAIVTQAEGNDVKTAPFKALRIRHDNGAVQVIVLYVSDIGEIRSSAIAGTVTIDNVNGGFSQGRDNVTNVAETIIAAELVTMSYAKVGLRIHRRTAHITATVQEDRHDEAAGWCRFFA